MKDFKIEVQIIPESGEFDNTYMFQFAIKAEAYKENKEFIQQHFIDMLNNSLAVMSANEIL